MLAHAPGKAVGRVEDSTLLPPVAPALASDGLPPEPFRRAGPVAMYVGNLERYQGIDLLCRDSG